MQSALGQVVGSDLVRQPSQSLSLSVRHRDRTFVHAHYSACHHTGGGGGGGGITSSPLASGGPSVARFAPQHSVA